MSTDITKTDKTTGGGVGDNSDLLAQQAQILKQGAQDAVTTAKFTYEAQQIADTGKAINGATGFIRGAAGAMSQVS